jgi:hypothetical protein
MQQRDTSITARVAIARDVVPNNLANVLGANVHGFDELSHWLNHWLVVVELAENVLVGENRNDVEEEQAGFDKLDAELTVKFFLHVHQLDGEFKRNTGVVKLDGIAVGDERVNHHLRHVKSDLVECSEAADGRHVVLEHLIHRDWPVLLGLMGEQREERFHGFVLVDFVAVETFQQVIVAIVFVVLVGNGFVGVEETLIAEAAHD